jgi:hypothetical protein
VVERKDVHMSWTDIAGVIGPVGGVVGMVFGGLGIWYSYAANRRNSEAHEILIARFRREEAEKEISRRKDDLLRVATERAYAMESASTAVQITLPLESDLDRKAAWELH